MASERVQRQIDRLLDEAEEASSKQDWETVQARAQHVLTFEPENPDGLAFLAAAGRALGVSPNSAPPTPQAKTTPTEHPTAAATAPEAERRQLTVMFCDLQGSTALSQQLDPEKLRDVIRSYQEVCAEAVGRFEGHIAKYLGDGLLIYFGYPQAHEDDPQRAVRGGLSILEDMKALNTRLKADKDLELVVRIGVHTGLVVAGEMGGGETVEALAIVGETPNIAARLQEVAEPNSVVISNITSNLIKGFFVCEAIGSHELKGISEPMELFRVVSERGFQTRFDIATTTQLTPLVGREQELGLLLDRWEQVEEGRGQVVLVSGEAGIGKSRLLQAITARLADRPHFRQIYRCSAYHQNSALHPIIEFIEHWLQFRREDSPQEKLSRIEQGLENYSVQKSEAVPLLAGFLSVPLDDRYPPLNRSPQLQRQKIMEFVVNLAVETASKQPVLFVIEDLHWADPSTLEYLGLLVDQAPTVQILILFTFRPQFTPPWGSRAYVTDISLNRLPRRFATDMLGQLTGGKALPQEVISQIATKSDGVPLFVEELTRMVIESGLLHEVEGRYELSGPLPPLAIPSTLQDSLTARLDRLSSVRESIQLAAVLGHEFSYELIRGVSLADDVDLAQHLEQLVTSEFLYQRGVLPESSYIFKHALIQDAAYNSLLISRRQQYHQQVAQVLEERFPETAESEPELLAHHFTEAGMLQEAVDYWERAGQRAIHHSASPEAVNHLTNGLAMVETFPDTADKNNRELSLLVRLATPLIATKGYAAPEVEKVLSRARHLYQLGGASEDICSVLWGEIEFNLVQANLETCRELATEFLDIARAKEDMAALVVAHRMLGTCMLFAGELSPGLAHLEECIADYDKVDRRDLITRYGHDLKVSALAWSAWCLWRLGYPNQAMDRLNDGLSYAEKLDHPLTNAYARNAALWLFRDWRDQSATVEHSKILVELSKQQGFTFWLALGNIYQAWNLGMMGQVDRGIEGITKGLDDHLATGAKMSRPAYLGMLADLYSIAGQADCGLEALANGLELIAKTGERLWESELLEAKGKLLLTQDAAGSKDEAEIQFLKAIDVAKDQKAKTLELKATTSLSRLWRNQGKNIEARELLAGIYGWFTEGFDTPDLIDAKALLEELA